MDTISEVPRFKINTEIKYFEQPATQTFFTRWCEINDSITPQFVDRDSWTKKDFLRPNDKGGKTLSLPKDLQPWEMVDVIEEVDKDTYVTNPNLATKKREELRKLGEMFQNTGIYIAQRIDGIDQGKTIAENLAQDFYSYGFVLLQGERPESAKLTEIAKRELAPDEIDQIDIWLSGDKLYKSRRAEAEKRILDNPKGRDEILEEERQKGLTQFFRIAQKAMDRQSLRSESEMKPVKAWEKATPIKEAFLNEIENQIRKAVETPQREFINAIFRRGLENLVKETKSISFPGPDREREIESIKESYYGLTGRDFMADQQRLREVIEISRLKNELEIVRATNDKIKISQKEVEVVSRIQNYIRMLPFKSAAHSPSEIIANGFINCVGASALGGSFLSELGINHLVGTAPEHSILLVATSDEKVIWFDMLNDVPNQVLTDQMIQKTTREGKVLKVSDVWDFSHNPTMGGLVLDMDLETFRTQIPGVKEDQSPYLTLLPSNVGLLVQVLGNTASLLHIAGMKEEAIEAFQLAIEIDPQADLYKNLAITLFSLGRFDETIEAARKAIALDPRHMDSYKHLGKALVQTNRLQEAEEVYNKALEINPRDIDANQDLGGIFTKLRRFNEAMNLYHDLISIDPKNVPAYLQLGVIYWTFGQNKEAIEFCNKAIKVANKDSEKDMAFAAMAEKVIHTLTVT